MYFSSVTCFVQRQSEAAVDWVWIRFVFCVNLMIVNKELQRYQIINSGQETKKTRCVEIPASGHFPCSIKYTLFFHHPRLQCWLVSDSMMGITWPIKSFIDSLQSKDACIQESNYYRILWMFNIKKVAFIRCWFPSLLKVCNQWNMNHEQDMPSYHIINWMNNGFRIAQPFWVHLPVTRCLYPVQLEYYRVRHITCPHIITAQCRSLCGA